MTQNKNNNTDSDFEFKDKIRVAFKKYRDSSYVDFTDYLFENYTIAEKQDSGITKAHAFDILSEQVKELKETMRQLIEVGELIDIEFTDKKDTEKFQAIVDKQEYYHYKN